MSSDHQDVKPTVTQADDQKICIKVQDEHDQQVIYKIKASTPLGKIFDNYASRNNSRKEDLRFYFDGQKLKDTDTLTSVGKI